MGVVGVRSLSAFPIEVVVMCMCGVTVACPRFISGGAAASTFWERRKAQYRDVMVWGLPDWQSVIKRFDSKGSWRLNGQ